MTEGAGAIYNNFKEQVMEGIFLLQSGGHSLKITLHTGYTPDIDNHALWGDAGVSSTEYGDGAGYLSNNKTLTGQDVTQENTPNLGKFDSNHLTSTNLAP